MTISEQRSISPRLSKVLSINAKTILFYTLVICVVEILKNVDEFVNPPFFVFHKYEFGKARN